MRVDWWVDDRRDPAKATVAATEYLIDLHKMFSGNWELAWAAYNGGPGRVRSAMKRSGAKDFWGLVRADILHSETENYVPKIMAAAIVSRYAERYGFEVPTSNPLTYQVAQVDGSVALSVISEAAGLDEEKLRRLNPGLRRFATPPEGYGLRVPVGSKDRVLARLAEIPAEQRVEIVRHTVKRGETLSSIAARYSVPVDVISRTNRLKNVDRIYVGLELVVPTTETAARVSSAGTSRNQGEPSTYTVREGDSLSRVAARYGVTIDELRRWNSIEGSTIFVGQQLTMRGATTPTVETTHKVASGESLSAIASRYGVTVRELQDWNGIRNPSHIQVGQSLKVRTAAPQWREYTVKKGDSLGAIANREGCSVNDIVGWNSLGSTTIHPGQMLRLR